jgi:hypothetical protein
VDRKQLRSGQTGAPVVKQDFLMHDRNANPPEITYYTGFQAPGPHQSIEAFCERFGEPNYGCARVGGRWRCRDHHYSLEEGGPFSNGAWFRRAIDVAIQTARNDG